MIVRSVVARVTEQPGTWVMEYTGNMGDTSFGEGRPLIRIEILQPQCSTAHCS